MNTKFDTSQDVVIVLTRLWGPTGDVFAEFILDTGAVETIVSANILNDIGYDLTQTPGKVRLTTASGVEFAPHLLLDKIQTLGQERIGFWHFGTAIASVCKN